MERSARERRRWLAPFLTIWAGQAASLFGSRLVQFALIWWLTETTGSATTLAAASVAALVPGLLLGPIAGACVDRWNRRLLMIAADSLIALATLGLIALYALGSIRPWHIYVAMFVRSIGDSFHSPAMAASTALMVPKEQLTRIAGLNRTLRGAMRIVAPPLGAFLISILPLQGVLAVDIVTALLAVTPLCFIAIPQPRRSAREGSAGAWLWRDVAEGLRYVWNWRGLCLLFLMAALINLTFNPAFTLMPLLVTDHLGGGIFELGWVNSGWGLGLVAGGLILSAWGGFRRRVLTILYGVIVMGLATMTLGLLPAGAFRLALLVVILDGVINPIATGPVDAILQSGVAPEMQGRVFTVMEALVLGTAPLGMVIAGPVADALGVQAIFVAAGLTCILMGVAGLLIPAVVHLEDGREPAQPVVEAIGSSEPVA